MQLTFISYYPDSLSERDGFMQRVKTIDSLVENHSRQYIELYSRSHYHMIQRNPNDKLSIFCGNVFMHFPFIWNQASQSRLIYVHSIYNALKVLPIYRSLGSKIITDLHGIVPEELHLQGRNRRAKLMSFVESVVVQQSSLLVTVSDAMSEYFIQKYSHINLTGRLLRVPIIDLANPQPKTPYEIELAKRSAKKIKALYAGGLQSWQNINRILRALSTVYQKASDKYEFSIFVPRDSVNLVRKMASEYGIGSIEIESLPHGELIKRYQQAHLGFILREDVPVNRVAMPTKLIEYLEYGLVPIVLSRNIGDYPTYGYQTIDVDSWELNPEPSIYAFDQMRLHNYEIVRALRRDSLDALGHLERMLRQP